MTVLNGTRVRHSVTFRLNHEPGSPEEADFLAAAEALASLPTVEEFELLREVSPNEFTFVISMEFADRAAFEAYNKHPDHVGFVEGRWPEVAAYLEIDSAPR